ncbi:hypothetical protein FQA39_LY06074 [Lamprigera yunnana]|nr:hypothetical protein FQA39_LY06074 [Lamprigera yunnana]
MKTAIVIIIFSSLFAITVTGRVEHQAINVRDVLQNIIDCIFRTLGNVGGGNIPPIILELEEALDRLLICTDVDIQANGGVLNLIECLLSEIANATEEDLAKIVSEIGPLIANVNTSLTCIIDALAAACGRDPCPIILGINLCKVASGLGLTQLITALLDLVIKGLCGLAINVKDVLQNIIDCIFRALGNVGGGNIPPIILELEEALDRLLICTDVDIQADGGVLNLIECLLSEIANATEEDLAKIISEIGPLIANVNTSLLCIRETLKAACGSDPCPTILGINLCDVANGLGLNQLITALLDLVRKGLCGLAIDVKDVLQNIIDCIFRTLGNVGGENIPPIILELEEALDRLLICTDVDIQTDGGVLNLIECLLSEIANATEEDLAKIVSELGPLIANVNTSLTCIIDALSVACGRDPCPIILGINLCEVATGLGLNQLITALLGLVINGLCTIAIDVGDVLRNIIKCIFDSLEEVTEENLPTVIVELKEVLDKLLICTNVDIQADGGVLNLIQCAIDEIGNASQEDLVMIINEIGPIVGNLNTVLSCIRNIFNEVCGFDPCPTVLGIDLCTASNDLGLEDVIIALLELIIEENREEEISKSIKSHDSSSSDEDPQQFFQRLRQEAEIEETVDEDEQPIKEEEFVLVKLATKKNTAALCSKNN